ncbi:hypothetical protein E2542_SST08440 [Spatholobus suberectus]|nr:hypothetical protein E2542_SST08440 [Spatholobus suberectus]
MLSPAEVRVRAWLVVAFGYFCRRRLRRARCWFWQDDYDGTGTTVVTVRRDVAVLAGCGATPWSRVRQWSQYSLAQRRNRVWGVFAFVGLCLFRHHELLLFYNY